MEFRLELPSIGRSKSVRACAYIMVLALAGAAGSAFGRLGNFAVEAGTEPADLFSNGYFQALHGYFFLEGEKLHVYRALPSVLNPKTQKVELSPEDDELKALWKGEPYYHEVYILDDGEWVPKMWGSSDTRGKREFSQPPTQYFDFGSCDANDQIDLPNEEIREALWPRIKLKNITELGNYAIVVFSEAPRWEKGLRRPPSNQRVLEVVLVSRGKHGWEFVDNPKGGLSSGRFCGARTLSTRRGDENCTVWMLFSLEGDYSVLWSVVLDHDAENNFLRKYRQWPESKKP